MTKNKNSHTQETQEQNVDRRVARERAEWKKEWALGRQTEGLDKRDAKIQEEIVKEMKKESKE